MAYKIDADKGFKILECTFPNLVFVNGPRLVLEDFVVRFKKTDFSVLKLEDVFLRLASRFKPKATLDESKMYIRSHFEVMDGEAELGEFPVVIEEALISELHTYMNRFRTSPCVIVGCVGSWRIIEQIFDSDHAIFTYVYLYPNKSAIFKQVIADEVKRCAASIHEAEGEAVDADMMKLVQKYQAMAADAKNKAAYTSALNTYTRQMLARRKKIYTTHLEELGRALTILV